MGFFKLFFTVLFMVLVTFVRSQQPSYKSVLEQERVSNPIENTAAAERQPYVIMVSVDGFRFDYAEKHGAKNLLDMASKGVSTQRMIPAFPSKTFPNHYTLVTGMYPQTHGIVANSFIDTKTGKRYRISDRQAVEDGGWYGGVPLWNLAQLQGMVAASYFWVGSEADVNGLHPKYYYPYDKNIPYEYRVQRVLEWLQLPEKDRPHMITLYFSLVDTIGHRYGADAQETQEAVQYVDTQLGALREGLKALGLPVYLIVTSDHGMDDVYNLINIKDYIDVPKDRFLSGPVAMIYTASEEEREMWYTELVKQPLFRTYRREEMPSYLNFKDNPRIGDLVLITDSPFNLVNIDSDRKTLDRVEGTHGYDPYLSENMGGIFYLEGPTIKKGLQIPPFENIHVYPLVAQLLGLQTLMPVDGRPEVLKSVIQTE